MNLSKCEGTPGAGARENARMRSSVSQLAPPNYAKWKKNCESDENPLKRMENCFQLFKNNVS